MRTPVLAGNDVRHTRSYSLKFICFVLLLMQLILLTGRAEAVTPVKPLVGAGEYSLAALQSDGTVKAWGLGFFGQMGNGLNSDQVTPTTVDGLSGVVAIAEGPRHTLALLNNGTVKVWGYNVFGGLGLGSSGNTVYTPTTIPGLSEVVAISAADRDNSAALLSDGTVMAWGNNGYGQLGNGTIAPSYTPITVPGLSGVAGISSGYHTLAVMNDGTVMAWGNNNYGQSGPVSSLTPVTIPGLGSVKAVATGYVHSLALLNDGTVKAWGNNGNGQLGLGAVVSVTSTPTTIPDLSGVVSLSVGRYHSIAVLSDGTVKAWGYNANGQLGLGSSGNVFTPTTIPGLSTAVGCSAGVTVSIVVLADGTVKVMGDNSYGALGNGTTGGNSTVAVAVPGLNLDASPPLVVADPAAGTYNASLQVTLTCTDNFSGCANTYYTTDGSDPSTSPTRQTYIAPLSMPTTSTINYYAIDSAGNAGAIQSATYTIEQFHQAVTVNTSPAGMDFIVDGTTYSTAQTFDWLQGSTHEITVAPHQVVSSASYSFANWSDAGAVSHQITVPATPATYTATFTPDPVNAVCGNSSGGTFTSPPATGLCSPGTPSSLKPTTAGWTWSCAGIYGGNPASCSAASRGYTVTFVASGNGTLSGATSQNVPHGGNTTPVYAIPASGYHFDWTGTNGFVATRSRSVTLTNVTASYVITANFVSNYAPYFITVPATSSTGTYMVSWASSSISGVTYVLEASKDGGAFTPVYSGQSAATTVTVASNGTYVYRVKATKAGYSESAYATSTGCTVTRPCGAPARILAPATNSTGTFMVSWVASNSYEVTYVLEASKDGGGFTPVYSGPSSAANVTVTSNGTYVYRVKATKAGYAESRYITSGNCVVKNLLVNR